MTIKLMLAGPPPTTCGAEKSKRSTARCELPPGHGGAHFGRTYGGYWKSWGPR